MPIDFPNSPSTNDMYTAAGKTWVYNGTAWVLTSITQSNLPNNSVTTAAIANGAVTAAKLASGATDPSTTVLTGGTPSTIQFHVMGAVDAGGI